MTVLYDSISYNQEMLLDLPLREGIGTITQDVAKPHHPITLMNTPTWTQLANGLVVLTLNGTNEYLQCLNADCVDLEFTTGDYSLWGWINWSSGDDSQIVIGRYAVDIGGWELYLYDDPNYYLTLRHHHAGGTALRSGCYSGGWTQNTWYFVLVTRHGSTAQFYRGTPTGNLQALTTTGSLEDPEATTSDLVIGVRYSKDDNNFKNMIRRLRISGRALSFEEGVAAFKHEQRWYA
ncbi:unnamed protein product [marine sediment metagenome]|uniref:LamG-like jellyroll fold domain-containing protein n=1 Tax=marine sediment metagenome TaxID=412755 RepID=X0ZKF9_9ZZZZ